jgi:NTP pyrophosphatase (non-canonical NTP hydrolase)
MVNLTKDQIMEKAQEITQDLTRKLGKFIEETGCVIQTIEIKTDETPLGQTGMSQIRQTVQAHFTAPANHPAFAEVPHADD